MLNPFALDGVPIGVPLYFSLIHKSDNGPSDRNLFGE